MSALGPLSSHGPVWFSLSLFVLAIAVSVTGSAVLYDLEDSDVRNYVPGEETNLETLQIMWVFTQSALIVYSAVMLLYFEAKEKKSVVGYAGLFTVNAVLIVAKIVLFEVEPFSENVDEFDIIFFATMTTAPFLFLLGLEVQNQNYQDNTGFWKKWGFYAVYQTLGMFVLDSTLKFAVDFTEKSLLDLETEGIVMYVLLALAVPGVLNVATAVAPRSHNLISVAVLLLGSLALMVTETYVVEDKDIETGSGDTFIFTLFVLCVWIVVNMVYLVLIMTTKCKPEGTESDHEGLLTSSAVVPAPAPAPDVENPGKASKAQVEPVEMKHAQEQKHTQEDEEQPASVQEEKAVPVPTPVPAPAPLAKPKRNANDTLPTIDKTAAYEAKQDAVDEQVVTKRTTFDWTHHAAGLPVGRTDSLKKERKAFFASLDSDGGQHLTYEEVRVGIQTRLGYVKYAYRFACVCVHIYTCS
jgi:hypothetical protein